MKITFTLFLILFVSGICQAQIPNKNNENSASSISVEIAENQSFTISKIYPNPVKESVLVEIQLKQSDFLQVKLFNILGTEVKNWEPMYLAMGDQKFKLDLSAIKTGVYILRFKNSNFTFSQVIRKN
ncbi:MAG: T9SS type A sorting domain-containing protein [Prolixibacteraceae bacterium]